MGVDQEAHAQSVTPEIAGDVLWPVVEVLGDADSALEEAQPRFAAAGSNA